MQQISLSSLNILPNQTKDANNASVTQVGNSPNVAPNLSFSNVESRVKFNTVNVPVAGVTSLNIQGDQSVEDVFIGILNGLELSQSGSGIQEEDLAKLKNLLNENPALFDQIEQNPKIIEQLQALLEGQDLSTTVMNQGEVLPPLPVEEVSVDDSLPSMAPPILPKPDQVSSNLELEKAEIPYSVFNESEVGDQGIITRLDLSTGSVSLPNTKGEFAVTMPLNSAVQNNSNAKNWNRFTNGTQTISASGVQNTETAAVTTVQTEILDGAKMASFQSETDAQFKSTFDSALRQPNADIGELLESSGRLERGEQSRTQFSEIQSKVQGAGLKQYTTSLDSNVNDPDWGGEMGQKIVWLTGRAIQSAEIHLNPADLGPIDVKINVQNEQTTVTFHAQNTTVRDMLESNVQRLRDMMNENGVDLTEVSVGGGESENQYSAQSGEQDTNGQGGSSESELQSSSLSEKTDEDMQVSNISNRIVDFYA